jgi:hypothetical protein
MAKKTPKKTRGKVRVHMNAPAAAPKADSKFEAAIAKLEEQLKGATASAQKVAIQVEIEYLKRQQAIFESPKTAAAAEAAAEAAAPAVTTPVVKGQGTSSETPEDADVEIVE